MDYIICDFCSAPIKHTNVARERHFNHLVWCIHRASTAELRAIRSRLDRELVDAHSLPPSLLRDHAIESTSKMFRTVQDILMRKGMGI
jgi:hypothetical protein